MPWYNGDYPPSYKNQPGFLKEKAVEIANALLEEGVEEGIAIATGLKCARQFFEDNADQDNLQEIESDSDGIEPAEFGINDGIINTEDPDQLKYWAEQFQVSPDTLKGAAAIRGDRISEIKKYLQT